MILFDLGELFGHPVEGLGPGDGFELAFAPITGSEQRCDDAIGGIGGLHQPVAFDAAPKVVAAQGVVDYFSRTKR